MIDRGQSLWVREALYAGFEEVEVIERDPYPGVEYPSRRAYLFARRLAGGGGAPGTAEPVAAPDPAT